MKKWLLQQLQTLQQVKQLTDNHKTIYGESDVVKALMIAASYYEKPRRMMVVTNNAFSAQKLYDQLAVFMRQQDLASYIVEESLRVEAISASPESSGARVETLNRLILNHPLVLVTHSLACVKYLPNIDDFKKGQIELKIGDIFAPKDLMERLIACGYSKVSHVYAPLTFASRGSIIDVYPIDNDPIRIEYFDDEIESIRYFEIETQKSIKNDIEHVSLSLASEYYFNLNQIQQIHENVNLTIDKLKDKDSALLDSVKEDLKQLDSCQFSAHLYPYVAYCDGSSTLFDYMDNAQVICYPLQDVNDSLRYYQLEATTYLQELVENKHLLPKYAIFDASANFSEKIDIQFTPFSEQEVEIHSVDLANTNIQENLHIINNYPNYDYKVIVLNDSDIEKVINQCVQLDIQYNLIMDEEQPLQAGLNIIIDNYLEGFSIDSESLRLVVFTPTELFSRKTALYRYANKFKNAERLTDFNELQVNDYVVHNQYGIGQYIGIETKVIQGCKKDYLHILYADNGDLFVPLEQYHLVRKFSGHQGVAPRLNKLGSDKWSKTKEKLESDLADLANRLVQLYADRKQEIGFAFPPDSKEQINFENEFEYPLTADQQVAVTEIKQDMESKYPMDRLLCGDVGFGKTEVAIRAAYKAVEANKQVAVLCPTTLLSRQHYITFTDRFKDYPIRVCLLNRFISSKDSHQLIKDIKEHKVDIIIGTHRLLSGDITYADLGLLVIDEEHRFGVEQKEKISQLKHNIDVLSLSATPIPRTMQMSLTGVRPCSQLRTPPSGRYPVATYVVERNEKFIKEIIEKELSRSGQVFYLVNDTFDIYNFARKINTLIPSATIGVVHGKMDKDDIDMTMDLFIQNKINVLLCTTVIENGIDIPNANTMIVENAHLFGLAQLYQIKGRVGRSNRVGYAYFLVPPQKQLSEVAQKRLQAVKEFTHLGDGYQLAMRDLMIRGAGDLLGAKQSGFIDMVGFDMIMDVLKQQIQNKKDILDAIDNNQQITDTTNKQSDQPQAKSMNLSLNTTIPNTFTENNYDKIDIVTKLSQCNCKEDIVLLSNQLQDEYGKFPSEINELFLKRRFECACTYAKVDNVRISKEGLDIALGSDITMVIDGELIFYAVQRLDSNANISLKMNKIHVIFKQSNMNNLKHGIQLLENIDTLFKKVKKNASR